MRSSIIRPWSPNTTISPGNELAIFQRTCGPAAGASDSAVAWTAVSPPPPSPPPPNPYTPIRAPMTSPAIPTATVVPLLILSSLAGAPPAVHRPSPAPRANRRTRT